MKRLFDILEEDEKTLYHVTLSKHLPKINKQGLRRFQTSNWVQAGNKKRYGQGELYAFEHPHDATRWGARMDWEHHKKTGTGKISVVKIRHDPKHEWKTDEHDPMSQAGSRGRWLKSEKAIPKSHIIGHYPVTTEAIRDMIKSER
jgi:hypothetical protein